MKYLLLLLVSSCGLFVTGDGVFNGRIVDVGWEGLIVKSCEIDFQLGEQSSSLSKGSTRNKQLCDKLSSKIGQVISIKYKSWFIGTWFMDTPYEIYE